MAGLHLCRLGASQGYQGTGYIGPLNLPINSEAKAVLGYDLGSRLCQGYRQGF